MKPIPYGIAPMRPSARYALIRTSPWLFLFFAFAYGALVIHPLLIIASWFMMLTFCYHIFLLSSELYVITPDMFMISKGLVYQTVTWLELQHIKDYDIHYSKFMGYLGIVHITITSTEDLKIRLTLKGVGTGAIRNAFKIVIDVLEMRKEYYQSLIDLAEKLKPNQQ